jgi:hypothetical protein
VTPWILIGWLLYGQRWSFSLRQQCMGLLALAPAIVEIHDIQVNQLVE